MLEYIEQIKKEIPSEDSAEEGERLLLYSLVKALKPKVVVETGTHRGLTTLYMAHGLYENGEGRIYTADPFDWGARGNFRKFPALEKHITFVEDKGANLKIENIDLLFVDGFHEKEEVLAEIDVLFPYLNKGAVVLFHDARRGNEPHCDVNGALQERGLKTFLLPTHNHIQLYVHENNSDNPNN